MVKPLVPPLPVAALGRFAGGAHDAFFASVSSPCGYPEHGNATEDQKLRPDSMVHIGGAEFRVTSAIGEGSFGAVWGADAADGAQAAIKEIHCKSQAELSDAIFEVQLLRELSRRDPLAELRIPTFLASDCDATPGRVRLAMSRLPGENLGQLLERCRLEWKREPRRDFLREAVEACDLAAEIVRQLAPTLEAVNVLACHRDVNPGNILVSVPGPGRKPRCGLVDFGLAVDVGKWQAGVPMMELPGSVTGSVLENSGENEEGPCSSRAFAQGGAWQRMGVGGDAHYWPVSAWMMFEYGAAVLSTHQPVCNEYLRRLDMHSLGLSAMQVLAELLPAPEDVDCDSPVRHDPLLKRLWDFRAAWDRYWADASRYWQGLFDAFRGVGDFNELRDSYVSAAVHDVICADLHELRCAVRDVGDTYLQCCEGSSGVAAMAMLDGFCEALLALVSAGYHIAEDPSWKAVRRLLGLQAIDGNALGASAACRGRNAWSVSRSQPLRQMSPAADRLLLPSTSPPPRALATSPVPALNLSEAAVAGGPADGPTPAPTVSSRDGATRDQGPQPAFKGLASPASAFGDRRGYHSDITDAQMPPAG